MGKKVLSFFLAVVLSLSLMPCIAAMADPVTDLKLDETKEIDWTLDEDGNADFTFTPESSGNYVIVVASVCDTDDGAYSYGGIGDANPTGTGYYMDGNKKYMGDTFYMEVGNTYHPFVSRVGAAWTSVTMKKANAFSDMKAEADANELKLDNKSDITLKKVNDFYYDHMQKIKIEEGGNYWIILNNLKKIHILDEGGEWQSEHYVESKITLSFPVGTYYIAFEYNDNLPDGGGSDPINGSALLQKAPEVKSISLIKKEKDATTPLYYGLSKDGAVGEWKDDGHGNQYFEFFEYCIKDQFIIKVEYTDGTEDTMANNENAKFDYDCKTFKIGDDNKVTVTVDGKKATGNITIYELLDKYVEPGSPTLELDVPVEAEDRGHFLFKAPEKGTYYFYSSSEGKIDPNCDLYFNNDDDNVHDDDGMGDLNFLVEKEMDAGERCYLVTYRERNENIFGLDDGDASDGQKYSVTVSKTNPLDKALDLSGTDLSRKRIELVLVINSSTTLEADIGQLKDSIADFAGKIAKTGADLRIALIDYADITKDNGEKETVIHKASENSIWYGSGDTDALIKELEGLKTTDNTDLSDCAVDALGNLISQEKTGYDQKAAKAAVLLTDYGSKDDNTHGIADMNELTEKLKEKGILVSVMTDKQYYNSYMALADGTGGILQRIYNDDPEKNDMSLNLSRLAVFLTEYTDKNIKPYEDEENTVSDNTVSDNSVSDNAVPDNPAQSDIITLSIGSTGYTISYTGTVSFNGVSHIEKGGKTSKKKAGDIEIKLIDPSGSEVTSGYKVKFKNNRNASDNGAYFTIKMKGVDKSVKNAVKAEKFYFRINPLDLSKVTLEAKKVSEAKIRGLSFTNETGAKIKLKPAKGSKGDFSIKGLSGNFVMIEGQGNYTGNGLVPLN